MSNYTLTRNPDTLTLTGVAYQAGALCRLEYTVRHTEDTVTGSAVVPVAGYALAFLYDWLAQDLAVSDPTAAAQYQTDAEALRREYAVLTGAGCAAVYATPAGILSRFARDEIAQLCDTTGLVTGEIFQAAVNAESLLSYTVEIQGAAKTALATLCRACVDADSYVLASLQSAGYGAGVQSPLLSTMACDLARYQLYDSGDLPETGVVVRRYKDAMKTLAAIAERKLMIGALPATAGGVVMGSPTVSKPARVFSAGTLGGY